MAENYRAESATELLHQLEIAGRAPDLELIRACMGRRHDLTEGLLDMLAAPPDEAWADDDPRWYTPIHAGHLLIYFREPRAIPIFMQKLRDPENDHWINWFVKALAAYGMVILPEARALLNDADASEIVRISVPDTLTELAAEFPTERAQVIAILRDALPPLDSAGKLHIPKPRPHKPNAVWSFVAGALAELHDLQSRSQIEALYQDGWMDDAVMGDLEDYLELLLNPAPLTPKPFNIVEAYQALRADAVREQEWQAKRQEILAQQEKIKQANAPAEEEPVSIVTAPPEIPGVSDTAQSAVPAAAKSAPPPQPVPVPQTIRRAEPKIGRNDPCPCGSGRKYKHCHGK